MKDALSSRVVAHYFGGAEVLPESTRAVLGGHGIQVLAAPARSALRKMVSAVPADVLLISSAAIGDPARGLAALRQLYGRQGLPMIVLAVEGLEADALAAILEAGASDVLVAPIDPELLAARVDAAVRTVEQLAAPTRWPKSVLRTPDGEIAVDRRAHRCLVREGGTYREVLLTRKQLEALAALLRAGGKPVRWEDLFRRGWRPGKLRRRSRTLVQHVIVLRRKLGPAGRRIVAIPGIGYRLAS